MSTNRGIFETFPNQAEPNDSPFAVVQAAPAPASQSPFAAAGRAPSPFLVVEDSPEARQVEPGRPAKLPEKRPVESPFQAAEPSEGYAFDASQNYPFSRPPESGGFPHAPVSPFSVAPPQFGTPASVQESQRTPASPTQAAIAAFGNWQEQGNSYNEPAFNRAPAPAATPPSPVNQYIPAAFSPSGAPSQLAAQPNVHSSPTVAEMQSDSYSIRQLELRAIFGVDREMNAEEILQRTRALPGMRNVARVNPEDMGTIEAVRNLLPNLGFGSGGLKLYAGSVPLEFVREGNVLLAVQTDGGFAPGVRETLMLVARELGRQP